jgi:hypothetical protein
MRKRRRRRKKRKRLLSMTLRPWTLTKYTFSFPYVSLKKDTEWIDESVLGDYAPPASFLQSQTVMSRAVSINLVEI